MTVKLWKLEGGVGKEVQTFRGHRDWITSVAFSKDGFYILSSGVDKLLKISEITSQEVPLVAEQERLGVRGVRQPGRQVDRLSRAHGDSNIRVWDREASGKLKWRHAGRA